MAPTSLVRAQGLVMAALLTEIGEAREEADTHTQRKTSSNPKYCPERKEPSVPREELGDS